MGNKSNIKNIKKLKKWKYLIYFTTTIILIFAIAVICLQFLLDTCISRTKSILGLTQVF